MFICIASVDICLSVVRDAHTYGLGTDNFVDSAIYIMDVHEILSLGAHNVYRYAAICFDLHKVTALHNSYTLN